MLFIANPFIVCMSQQQQQQNQNQNNQKSEEKNI